LAIVSPRKRWQLPTSARAAPLIAGACLLISAQAGFAQSSAPWTDPFAPTPSYKSTKPFQRVDPKRKTPLGPSLTFTPAASGAGRTGFDSSNSRRQKKPRKANAQAIAPGPPQPLAPPASTPDTYAQAPANPPVEFGPIRKPLKPPKRKAHVEPDDPYAQLGLRAGSFDIYPAVELIGGYATNPGLEPNGRGARLLTIAPELRVQSNWSRHEFKSELRGSYTGYSPDETPTLSRPYLSGKADGRIDVFDGSHIDLGGRVLVSTDNPSSPNLSGPLARLPVFTTFGGSAGLTQRLNRLEIGVKAGAERTVYQDSHLTDGSTASNEDRNYNQFGGTLRAGYEMLPGVKPFVEAGVDTRKHDLPVDAFGYERNSRGLVGNIGTSFEVSRLITGEASVGYMRRTYDDARFDPLAGLIGNASLIWTVDGLNTVKLSASSTIGESTVPGVPGVFYRDAGIQIDHAFRRWLIGTLKLGIGFDSYKGSGDAAAPLCNCVVSTPGGTVADREDKRYSVGLGITYKVDRTVQVKGEFRQDWLRSNVSGVDYTASTFLVGLRLQR
jgi:hypothetical protein